MRSSLGYSFLFIIALLASAPVHSESWVPSHSKRFATTSGLLVLAAAVDVIKHDDRARRTGDVDVRPFFKKLRNRSAALCSLKNWVELVRQAGALFTAPEEEDKLFFKRVRVFVKNHKLVTIAFTICSINAGISVVQLINEFKKSEWLKAPLKDLQLAGELPGSVIVSALDVPVARDDNPVLPVVEPGAVTAPEPVVVLSESDQPSEGDHAETSPEKYEPQRSLKGQQSYQDCGYVVTAAMLTEAIKDWQPGRRKKRLMIKTGKDIPEGISITPRRRRRKTRSRTVSDVSGLPWSVTTEEATTASDSSVSPWVRRRPMQEKVALVTPVALGLLIDVPVAPAKEVRPFAEVINTVDEEPVPIDFSLALAASKLIRRKKAPLAENSENRRPVSGASQASGVSIASEAGENKQLISGRRASVISKASSSSRRSSLNGPQVVIPFGSTTPRF